MSCHCGAAAEYAECCGPFLDGRATPATAEQLMRSRYSAFAVENVDYIVQTTDPKKRLQQLRGQVTKWANEATFTGLEIRETVGGGPGDTTGIVEFTCHYEESGKAHSLTERSHFRRAGDRWVYVEGGTPTAETVVRSDPKVGRNEPCPCGSGRKYKRCCGG